MMPGQSPDHDHSLLGSIDVPAGWHRTSGKVREALWGPDAGVLLTTDRISAYDVVLGEIPGKGAILNQLSLFWLKQTADIIPNHLVHELGPRSVVVTPCRVLPVEVIVRGYLTGSAWRAYRDGQSLSGITLPAGLQEHHRFAEPIITPSTKADAGSHDTPISREEILGLGVVDPAVWQQVETAALALYRRGSEIVAANGLVLVDTKYEFGIAPDGRLHLIDEIHTPDSSRFWFRDDLDSELQVTPGSQPRSLDKEFLRSFLRDAGFTGEGTPPSLPDDIRREVARRYRETYRLITGDEFDREVATVTEELPAIIEFLQRHR
ncbi:phosphoribosylaminoimidazolesuccinocarboxamide synthase [Spirochaeta africana]|uniref:Phosphoribosylaminoimidazole-succinocarboxamide synthase n=1 Tax=Spirochaeta africana (strain ATCC 700263 / DSM 8902 / Z-7692) TaxID=889378 RepID=H9UGC0_SPIAZ|nr:phosphoribosylaminoimidazolesuccinocarboxamide synthase [Spirochaeta africana]AFG36563.1 phosphoribosylaminoimidazolesuccinocarboxamide (SAICAR) synthase [Spirochaeta africana DSM 8902]